MQTLACLSLSGNCIPQQTHKRIIQGIKGMLLPSHSLYIHLDLSGEKKLVPKN